jgi:predicted nucleic acid-binding protein
LKIIFDACALFNLVHGEVFEVIVGMLDPPACLGPQVRSESRSIAGVLDQALGASRIELLDDATLPASLFFALLEKYELGAGETECLAFASVQPLIICSDDRRARNMATRELGEGRVIGTLGLLIRATELSVLTPGAAIAAYELMRRRGGFLPDVPADRFSPDILRPNS